MRDLRGTLQALRLTGWPRRGDAFARHESILRHVVALQRWAHEGHWDHVQLVGAQCLGLGYALFRQLQGETAIAEFFRRPVSSQPIFARLTAGAGSSLDMALLALHRGILGSVHAAFNLAVLTAEARPKRSRASLRESFAAMLEEQETTFQSALAQLQSALSSKEPTETAGVAALALAGLIEERLPLFARAQGTAFAAIDAHLRDGQGTEAEQFGRLTVRAGVLTRRALAAHVAAYRLSIAMRGVGADEKTATLQAASKQLPLTVKFPGGPLVPLARLGDLRDRDELTVRAFVTSVRVDRTSDGKLVSFIDLVDPSSKAVSQALVIFTHLPHLGLTGGACCELSGRFEKSSNLAGGQAAIVVQRLSLVELARKSWQVAFLRTAERWYRALAQWRTRLMVAGTATAGFRPATKPGRWRRRTDACHLRATRKGRVMNGDPFDFDLPCEKDLDGWLDTLTTEQEKFEEYVQAGDNLLDAMGDADFECPDLDILETLGGLFDNIPSGEGQGPDCVHALNMLGHDAKIFKLAEKIYELSDSAADTAFQSLQKCLAHIFDPKSEEE